MVLLLGLAIIAYLAGASLTLSRLLHQEGPKLWQVLPWAGLAIGLHSAWWLLDVFANEDGGQNLSIVNVAILVSGIVSAALTLSIARHHSWLLLPVAYLFSVITLLAALVLPDYYITHLEHHPLAIAHASIALGAYVCSTLACLFALQLGYLNHQLKNKLPGSLNPNLPPLLVVEKQVFRLITVAWILLSFSVASGFANVHDIIAQGKAHKAFFSLITWLIYSTILWGHYRHGWRGKRVVTLTFVATLLMTIAYFGSRFVREILLDRV